MTFGIFSDDGIPPKGSICSAVLVLYKPVSGTWICCRPASGPWLRASCPLSWAWRAACGNRRRRRPRLRGYWRSGAFGLQGNEDFRAAPLRSNFKWRSVAFNLQGNLSRAVRLWEQSNSDGNCDLHGSVLCCVLGTYLLPSTVNISSGVDYLIKFRNSMPNECSLCRLKETLKILKQDRLVPHIM